MAPGPAFGDARVNLSYELTFTTGDPVLDGLYDFESSGVLVVDATPNLGSPLTCQDRADFVYLADEPQLGSLRAYEIGDAACGGNTVSVDIYGYLSSVHFVDFENVRGGGFINPSTAQQLATVPEPPTLALALAGFAALFGFRHRQRMTAARS